MSIPSLSAIRVETSERTERRRTLVFLLMCVAIVALAAPIRPGIVLGESMSPAFHSGQVFLAMRVSDPTTLERGDVVLVSVDGQVFLKRIYALGGDTVWGVKLGDGGEEMDRIISVSELPDVQRVVGRYRGLGEVVQLTVPEDSLYVLGDASANSYDSRYFGPVPGSAVRARVIVSKLARLWGPGDDGSAIVMAGKAKTVKSR
jgi:signal peptidase I